MGQARDASGWGGVLAQAGGGLVRGWREAPGAVVLSALAWSAWPFLPTGVAAVAAALCTLVLTGALARIAVSSDAAGARTLGLGPAGLQFGATEMRLLAGFALCGVFMAMILSVAALALLALYGLAGLDAEAIRARDWAGVGAPWKLALLGAITVAALYAVVALAARLSLFVPATAAEGRIVSLQVMGLTKRGFWPLLGGVIVTAAPKLALVVGWGLGVLRGEAGWIVWAVVVNGVQAPLTLAFLGAAYRRLVSISPRENAHG
ncbi:hypothetical protein [uncultured Brevundimonas sp.]|uniref:hypothetical protein n=1 Tax=uncultured Brevundimonas sp. TaxID=213418 RepID=UPI002597DD63|nr:hypothetical protein [uncultured Brevundimonas sp.]